MLHELYQNGTEVVKMGGHGKIVEVDEALLGRKPTYKHGKLNKIFKIWVLGIRTRTTKNQPPECILIPVQKRDTKTLGEIL